MIVLQLELEPEAEGPMFDLIFGLVVGTGIGYAIRAYISHRRHALRRRRAGGIA